MIFFIMVLKMQAQPPCSFGLFPASQQYFSLSKNQRQPPATNQPAVFFSQQKPAPVASHQPNEQDVIDIKDRRGDADAVLMELYSPAFDIIHLHHISYVGASLIRYTKGRACLS